MSTYNKKRDFNKTGEPKHSGSGKKNTQSIFVVQKHNATNLHYDFRLEIDDTLKSWSIPKGPSTNPTIKRMAIPTEDHPIAYADFEGTIPKGEYGGGTVMIWDKGTIASIKEDENGNLISLEKSFLMGSIEIILKGQKLKGAYNLVKMKGGKMQGNWLLLKQDDKYADTKDILETKPESAVTGRDLAQIAKEEE